MRVLLASAAWTEEDVTATVTLEPPVIPFHKQAVFTIAVEAPATVQVELPDMTELFAGLPLAGPPTRQTSRTEQHRIRYTDRYVLNPIFIGDYVIPPVETRAGAGTLVVPSPTLRVRDLTAEETRDVLRFEPNAEPSPVAGPLLSDWRFWVGLAAACSVVIAAYAYWRKIRARAAPSPPALAPWAVAYARLAELRARQWPRSGRFEPYYVELSDILRQYIEARFNLHAPEQTTPEFLAEASRSGSFSDSRQGLLADFLRHADRVKFAQYEPSLEQMDRSLSTVHVFVRDTVPPAESPVGEPEALGGAA
jgi:hypothetical protein